MENNQPSFELSSIEKFHRHDGVDNYRINVKDLIGFISKSSTLNFGPISPNSSSDLTITLKGAVNTNVISLGIDNAVFGGTNCGNISFFAWVSATDTVTVRCTNHDLVNTANPASGTFKVVINQL